MLLTCVLEDCIRRGEREFDFLRGSEAYKSRWTQESRRDVDLHMARGLIGHSLERLRHWARGQRPRLVPEAGS